MGRCSVQWNPIDGKGLRKCSVHKVKNWQSTYNWNAITLETKQITVKIKLTNEPKKITPHGYAKLCCSIGKMPKVNYSKRDVLVGVSALIECEMQFIENMSYAIFKRKGRHWIVY